MTTYVLRRLVLMVPVAFLVTVGVFMLIHLTPGDPALILLGEDRSPQAIAAIHQQLGLDKPLYMQYVIWLGHIVHGLSLIHISEPTRLGMISYAVFCLKKKNTTNSLQVHLDWNTRH